MTVQATLDAFPADDLLLAALLDENHRVVQRTPGWARVEPTPPGEECAFTSWLREEDAGAAQDAFAQLGVSPEVIFDARLRTAAETEWVRFRVSRAPSGGARVIGIPIGDLKAGRSETPKSRTVSPNYESSLHEARGRLFGRVLDSAPFLIWALDRNGIVTMSDGKGLSSVGAGPGDWIGRDALEAWKGTAGHEPIVQALEGREFHGLISLPGPLHFESWYLPVRGPSGEPDGMIGLALDVTRQRTVEAELRDKLALVESQRVRIELFGSVLDNAPLILSTMDTRGKFTLSEGKGLELIGLRPGEALGLDAFETFKGTPMEGALHAALLGNATTFTYEASPGLLFDNWTLPLTAKDGFVLGAATLSIDSSDRLRVERELRDKLGLIERQGETIRALATPILKIWEQVLCLPVIGTLDSRRTADVLESMLTAIVAEQARFAIVDLTGVEVVDTQTADHLIRLFKAAKLLGASGILCGVQPAVAQTVVALGTELQDVMTARTLADALRSCIGRMKQSVVADGRTSTSRPNPP